MNRTHSPTIRQLPPIRRVLAGALAIGAVAVAAPTAANAAVSTCSYSPNTKTLTVDDHSGDAVFRLVRVGEQIRIADGNAGTKFCPVPGQFAAATVTNTDKIQVSRDALSIGGGVILDMSQGLFAPGATLESDGSSEIEISVQDLSPQQSFGNQLRVIGSPQDDVMVTNVNGAVNFGNDFDLPDVTFTTAPFNVVVEGGAGNDRLRGAGASTSPGQIDIFGDDGNDTLMGGPEHDALRGGPGDDKLSAVDGKQETVDGDDINLLPKGNDFAQVDDEDVVANVETKSVTVNGVGRLKLAKSLHAVANEKTHIAIGWRHPKAWKALRSLEWRLMDGTHRVGSVKIKPRSGSAAAKGAIKLAAARVTHKGKTVTADLSLRLPSRLVGAPLTVDVAATDAKGHRQVEAGAALLDVTS